MALADIVGEILKDAKSQASQIHSEAQEQAQKIEAKAHNDAALQESSLEEKGKKKAEQVQKKVDNLVAHYKKEKTLQVKRKALNEVFELAKSELKKLSPKQKESIFLSMIGSIDVEEGKIHPVSGEKDMLLSVLKKTGKKFDLEKEEPGIGGFRFSSDRLDMDFRFESILERELKKGMERELTTLMFPGS